MCVLISVHMVCVCNVPMRIHLSAYQLACAVCAQCTDENTCECI